MTKLEQFRKEWDELSRSSKINIYRDYQREIEDEEWFDFDEEFFDIFFEGNPLEAIRAWHYGSEENRFNDEYIRINAYGNLETASEFNVEDEADGMVDEIFEHPEVWEDYITLDDEDEDA